MNNNQASSSWRAEYLETKTGLTESQIRLLKEGPTQLAQAWLLQAMHNDYKKMKGIKENHHKENNGQLQSSLEDFFENTKDWWIN